MNATSIPFQMSLAHYVAAALAEASDGLKFADNIETFITALNLNGTVWTKLAELTECLQWSIASPRMHDFVMNTIRSAGRGVHDQHIELLIATNLDVATRLAENHPLDSIRRCAEAAWREACDPQPLERWLIGQIEQKARRLSRLGAGTI